MSSDKVPDKYEYKNDSHQSIPPPVQYSEAIVVNNQPKSAVNTTEQDTKKELVFMSRPEMMVGVPRGLEYLAQLNQILVHQQVDMIEVFTNWECKNKYQIKNTNGEQIYFAAEESDDCMRHCCGSERSFVMHITDNNSQEVIRATRNFTGCASCGCCAYWNSCQMEVRVEAPVGQTIGYVRQQYSCFTPKFLVFDGQEQPKLRLQGPACICQGACCTEDVDFVVTQTDSDTEVGKISKQWSGLAQELFTKADNFGVSFPTDLDINLKATLIGAVFLIDFMFFEEDDDKHKNS